MSLSGSVSRRRVVTSTETGHSTKTPQSLVLFFGCIEPEGSVVIGKGGSSQAETQQKGYEARYVRMKTTTPDAEHRFPFHRNGQIDMYRQFGLDKVQSRIATTRN